MTFCNIIFFEGYSLRTVHTMEGEKKRVPFLSPFHNETERTVMLLSFFSSQKKVSRKYSSRTLFRLYTIQVEMVVWCIGVSMCQQRISTVKMYSSRVPGFYIWLLDSFLSAKKNFLPLLQFQSKSTNQPNNKRETAASVSFCFLSLWAYSSGITCYTYLFFYYFSSSTVFPTKSLSCSRRSSLSILFNTFVIYAGLILLK